MDITCLQQPAPSPLLPHNTCLPLPLPTTYLPSRRYYCYYPFYLYGSIPPLPSRFWTAPRMVPFGVAPRRALRLIAYHCGCAPCDYATYCIAFAFGTLRSALYRSIPYLILRILPLRLFPCLLLPHVPLHGLRVCYTGVCCRVHTRATFTHTRTLHAPLTFYLATLVPTILHTFATHLPNTVPHTQCRAFLAPGSCICMRSVHYRFYRCSSFLVVVFSSTTYYRVQP